MNSSWSWVSLVSLCYKVLVFPKHNGEHSYTAKVGKKGQLASNLKLWLQVEQYFKWIEFI